MNRKGWIGIGLAAALMLLVLVQLNQNRQGTGQAGRECLDCHRMPNINTAEGVLVSRAFCSTCHAQPDCSKTTDGQVVSMTVPEQLFKGDPHQQAACIHCHTDVARSPHKSVAGAQCLGCHTVHGERQAHAPHLSVRCEACHFAARGVSRDPLSGTVGLSGLGPDGRPVALADHRMAAKNDPDMCLKCHVPGNQVAAPATVLPSKSVLCIVCHPAPLAVGHGMFWLAAVIGGVGLFLMVSFWFRGSVAGESQNVHRKIALAGEAVWQTVFSRRIVSVAATLVFDVLLQRRLLQESVQRWCIHSLIYLAFLGRMGLGVLTLVVYNMAPASEVALMLIDKNHWFVALANDLLGLSILTGIVLAALQRFVVKPAHTIAKEQDSLALVAIGLVVVSGFILEGARLQVAGASGTMALFAPAGWLAAKFLGALPLNWQSAYGSLWYLHAGAWAALIAYLPFGKLRHVFTTPLSLLVGTQPTTH